jgi:chromosome partitioning protein
MPVVVSFVSQKGGVGKSTLARALLAVASHGMRARLADLDPNQASVVAWEATRRRTGVRPAYDVIGYRSVREAIAAGQDLDLLILDTPGGTGRVTLDLARASHLIVQPTGASADDLKPAVLTFHELVKLGVPISRLAAAICRILSSEEEAVARAYLDDAGYTVLDGAVMEKRVYRLAQNRGHAIVETTVARLNQQADTLMAALLDRVTVEIGRGSTEKKWSKS